MKKNLSICGLVCSTASLLTLNDVTDTKTAGKAIVVTKGFYMG